MYGYESISFTKRHVFDYQSVYPPTYMSVYISVAKPKVAGHSLIVFEILGAVLSNGISTNLFFIDF